MSQLYYQGDGQRHASVIKTETPGKNRYHRPEDYIAEPGLVNAVNVALILDKPLLLTGEPGTGKSQLAYSLAWELGFGEPLKFETKSTSTARDLFYTFDTVGRFRDQSNRDALSFVTYNALGKAILLANEEKSVSKLIPAGMEHGGKRRVLVLIDEVDKAPRDFPNDILNELEYLHFSIPELGSDVISADAEYRPIVIITSNSEKDLPDAFLRRCIYYNLPFPDRRILQNIVMARLGEFSGSNSPLLSFALDLFFMLRDQASQMRKKPATVELLDWLLVLRSLPEAKSGLLTEALVDKTLSSLAKTAEDQERAGGAIKRWFKSRP
jgi:MoxR-like ATPase